MYDRPGTRRVHGTSDIVQIFLQGDGNGFMHGIKHSALHPASAPGFVAKRKAVSLPCALPPSPEVAKKPKGAISHFLHLPVKMMTQPDETTCGPTCLQAIYRYWDDDESLQDIIARTGRLEQGGTFAVFLACDALRKGYRATIYTYNLTVFDPTWFGSRKVDIAQKLEDQCAVKTSYRLQHATEGYLEFLRLGGNIKLIDLSRGLIEGMLRRKLPILTGLSSTYLYRAPREYEADCKPDDVNGVPTGHFVVIAGYNHDTRKVLVMDPYQLNPYGPHEYWIGLDRVLGAVLLGIVTHDANLLVIHPRNKRRGVL
jgi:hypothetical protein